MTKKITGILKIFQPFNGKSKAGKDFTIYTIEVSNKLESVKLKSFSDMIISGYSDGDEVVAEYDVVIKGIYTNYNLVSLRGRKESEASDRLFKEKKKKFNLDSKIDYKKMADNLKENISEEKQDDIAEERVRAFVESVNNILTIGGKKYEVTFREIK